MREPFLPFMESKLPLNAVLITCGLPGTWKTETSEEVSRIRSYPIVRSDLVRKEVLKNEDIFDEKVASSMDKRLLVYDETFRQAEETIKKDGNVIIDATFITQPLRRRAAELAARHGKTLVIMQTSCPREVSIERILKRTKEDYESNALTEQAYINNEKKFEKVDLDDLKALFPALDIVHLIVDTQCNFLSDWYIIAMEKR